MTKSSILLTFFLIASIFSHADSYAFQNITINCEISSCLADKDACRAACELPGGLENPTTELQVIEVTPKAENFSRVTDLQLTNVLKELPHKIGEKFVRLEKFTVASTSLRYIKKDNFAGMSQVLELNLINNKIENFPYDTFSNLKKLEMLSLYGNKITYLHPHLLDSLLNLREFHADYNQIERIEANFFRKNSKIERISLNDNKLKTIHENFTALPQIQSVDLRRNFDYCTECEILDEHTIQVRRAECERQKFEKDKKAKENFEKCAKTKISEKDELAKKFDGCSQSRDQRLAFIVSSFDACFQLKEFPLTLQKIKDAEACAVQRIDAEYAELNKFLKCVDGEAERDRVLKELLTWCYDDKQRMMKNSISDHNECLFCEINMAAHDSVKKCEIRFVRDFGDDLKVFNSDVRRFFP